MQKRNSHLSQRLLLSFYPSHSLALFLSLLLSFFLSGCACQQNDDPFERFNRGVFRFNKALDRAVLKPVARVYQGVLPCFVLARFNSFFQNLGEIPTILNDILQADFYNANRDAWRFFINSTFGLGGFVDIAQGSGIPRHYADFGQTLGKWGYQNSRYVVLPFFGPSTVRDTIGRAGTYFMCVWPYLKPERLSWTLYGINAIDIRAGYLQLEPAIECSAVDEYILFRDAYLQKRTIEISSCDTNPQTNPLSNVTSETETLQGPPP